MESYVTRIEKTNWELKELGSDNSSYMSDIVRTLKYLSQQMHGLKCALPLHTMALDSKLMAAV